ncbi:hypothetical protein KAM461_22020 [Aeromonas hydrophila]|nr:hypothetical protein KAM461_22020 [Aeromonas hydrophila]
MSAMSITEGHKAIFYRLSLLGQVTLHKLIDGSYRNLFIIANLQIENSDGKFDNYQVHNVQVTGVYDFVESGVPNPSDLRLGTL